jgi:hypothetical protein
MCKIGSKEVPYFIVMTNTRRQRQNLIFTSRDPWAECCIDVFVKLDELFTKLAELFLCVGQKAISGPDNIVLGSVSVTNGQREGGDPCRLNEFLLNTVVDDL